MSIKLRPHQEEAVNKMHNGCILYGDVGVGKTITSLGYYFERVCNGVINKWGSMETPKDVYVITTAKVRDTKGFELQAAQYGIHTDPSLSTNGVRITVDSWNNLHKYTETKDAFFIFDEQRVVGYGAWSKAFIKIAKSNEWILLSATPGDTWLDYIPVFIANGWYKHKTDFLDQHVIWTPRVKYPKVLRYQNVGVLVRRRNDVLVHMPYERHTTRHPVDIVCDYDQEAFDKVVKKRWHVYEDRPLRDVSELFIVMRKVVNSDESRLTSVKQLLERHPKLIVFYNFDYELEMLRTLVPSTQLASPESIEQLAQKVNSSSHSRKATGQQTSSDANRSGSSASRSSASPKKNSSSKGQTTSSTGELVPGWIDGWGYLLSPEGMAANEQATSGKVVRADTAPTSTTSSLETVDTTGETVTDDAVRSASLLSLATGTNAEGVQNGAQTFAVAEWNGHKHEEIPKTDSWLYLVQYRAGSEGWNCIETDAICFFSQTYSYRDFFQAHGRIDRLNTGYSDLHYYYLISRSIIDKAIRKAQKVKKNFNEKDLKLAA